MLKIKQKKIAFVLFSSPRKNGNTFKLLDYYLKSLLDYEVVVFNVYEHKINMCIDCRNCKVNDGCIYKDFEEIDKYLNIADLLIIATPSYNLSFPAPLKTIFDRMQIYFNRRFDHNIIPPIKKKKDAVFLLTTGREASPSLDIMTKQLDMIFTIINAKLNQILVIENTDTNTIDVNNIAKNIKHIIR